MLHPFQLFSTFTLRTVLSSFYTPYLLLLTSCTSHPSSFMWHARCPTFITLCTLYFILCILYACITRMYVTWFLIPTLYLIINTVVYFRSYAYLTLGARCSVLCSVLHTLYSHYIHCMRPCFILYTGSNWECSCCCPGAKVRRVRIESMQYEV